MKHHLLTLLILVLAVALYAVGMVAGASALLFLGAALELWFWVRVMRRAKPSVGGTPGA